MFNNNERVRPKTLLTLAAAAGLLAAGSALAQNKPATYTGKEMRIGQGVAHTVVRADADGSLASIGVVFTPGVLEGLPKAAKGTGPDFAYVLPMPEQGPKTVVDHVVINWESTGHPPPHVYDVQHFDFHFYLVNYAAHAKIDFKDPKESGDPTQQPDAEILPSGYVVPPGTAVPGMGVHAVDPSAPEFHGQPFTATFIYGYYHKRQTFLEPMVSLAFLKSKPAFSGPVRRPASFAKPGAYPSSYAVTYDDSKKLYEVTLSDFK